MSWMVIRRNHVCVVYFGYKNPTMIYYLLYFDVHYKFVSLMYHSADSSYRSLNLTFYLWCFKSITNVMLLLNGHWVTDTIITCVLYFHFIFIFLYYIGICLCYWLIDWSILVYFQLDNYFQDSDLKDQYINCSVEFIRYPSFHSHVNISKYIWNFIWPRNAN